MWSTIKMPLFYDDDTFSDKILAGFFKYKIIILVIVLAMVAYFYKDAAGVRGYKLFYNFMKKLIFGSPTQRGIFGSNSENINPPAVQMNNIL